MYPTVAPSTVAVPMEIWIARRSALLEYLIYYASDELFDTFAQMTYEEYESMISHRHHIGNPQSLSASIAV
ncbi:MAG: hypothetical protein OXB96_01415 [Candidatus Kaiserbacteria bacterium]|nr:hypothetical protein [Candidatus Kaiserbacteria bacterium]